MFFGKVIPNAPDPFPPCPAEHVSFGGGGSWRCSEERKIFHSLFSVCLLCFHTFLVGTRLQKVKGNCLLYQSRALLAQLFPLHQFPSTFSRYNEAPP